MAGRRGRGGAHAAAPAAHPQWPAAQDILRIVQNACLASWLVRLAFGHCIGFQPAQPSSCLLAAELPLEYYHPVTPWHPKMQPPSLYCLAWSAPAHLELMPHCGDRRAQQLRRARRLGRRRRQAAAAALALLLPHGRQGLHHPHLHPRLPQRQPHQLQGRRRAKGKRQAAQTSGACADRAQQYEVYRPLAGRQAGRQARTASTLSWPNIVQPAALPLASACPQYIHLQLPHWHMCTVHPPPLGSVCPQRRHHTPARMCSGVAARAPPRPRRPTASQRACCRPSTPAEAGLRPSR